MTAQGEPPPRFSLRRWSRRKLEAETASAPTRLPSTAAPAPATAAPPATPTPVELPPVESLTFDSDFAAFLRPDVDDQLKRAALKQLFRDPRFNVMDGLDIYIDDYTLADPIAPDVLADLLRGFGGAGETGEGPAAGVAALEAGPVVTAVTPPATAEGSAATLTPAQPAPAAASGDESATAEREAEEADRAGAGADEHIRVRPTDLPQ